MMLRRMLVLLAALSLGYLGVGLLVVLWMTGPKRRPPWTTPASVGLEYEEVEIWSTDRVRLRCWWVPAGDSARVAVLVPGWGGYKFEDHLLQTLVVYHDAGYGVLMLDLRAQGESEGTRRTLGYREVRDVRGVLAWLVQRGYRVSSVVLHGWSMGGATVLRAAPGTSVAAVIEEAGYADLPFLLRGRFSEFVPFGALLEPAVLLALELRYLFDTIVLADEVEAVKPDPAPYTAALKKAGVPAEEALAFEDSVSGISSSVAAGVLTVGITSSQEPRRLLDAGAFMTAEDFTDPRLRRLIDP